MDDAVSKVVGILKIIFEDLVLQNFLNRSYRIVMQYQHVWGSTVWLFDFLQ
jgi:hypothetical protein